MPVVQCWRMNLFHDGFRERKSGEQAKRTRRQTAGNPLRCQWRSDGLGLEKRTTNQVTNCRGLESGRQVTVYASRYILGYSRMRYPDITLDSFLQKVLEALECGVRQMGGDPRRLLVGNARTMVIEHRWDCPVRYHQGFLKLHGYLPD